MRPLLFLYLAANAVALAATVPESNNLFWDLSFSSVSSWAVADLNGDQQIDVVTTRPGRHDAQGYSHEGSIRLGGSSEKGLFTFRGRSARVRLSIHDLDGDHDSDIVILEGSSPTAIGALLNDGFGHFREEDVASFHTTLSEHDPRSLWLPEKDSDPSAAIFEQRIDPAALDAALIESQGVLGTVELEISLETGDLRYTDRRPRAPPARA